MKKAGVPTIPGSEGLLESVKEGIKIANDMGYPVILKATAGGGGRGMRVVWKDEDWNFRIEDSEKLRCYLPVFSLQSLVENAIKHNGFTPKKPLTIFIRQWDNYIEVSNTIKAKQYGEISSKSGLSNLAERYYLLTGEEITVKNDGEIFSVGFKIIPDENSNH